MRLDVMDPEHRIRQTVSWPGVMERIDIASSLYIKCFTFTEFQVQYNHRLSIIDTSHHAVIMSRAKRGSAWFVIGSFC